MVKVVIDINIWVSALIAPFGHPAQVRQKWEEARFRIIISEPLLNELASVLSRPRIKDKYKITEK